MRRRPRGHGIGSPPRMTGAGSSRVTPISLEELAEKRARIEAGDSSRGKEKETITIPEEEEDGESAEGEAEADARAWARDAPWTPEFRHYSGR